MWQKIKTIGTHNFKIKAVAVILAVSIWFFVETENNYQYSFKIPVTISNLLADRMITNEIPTHVKISVWGKGQDILSLFINREFKYHIDLTDVKESINFPLSKNNVRLRRASNIEILNLIKPESIYFNIESIEEKKVAIKNEIEIIAVPGYMLVYDLKLEPDSITITGAKSSLDCVNVVQTEKVVYKKVKQDIRKKVKLVKPDIRNIWFKNDEVHFSADIQKLMEKEFVDIPVNIINKPINVNLLVIPSTLTLTLIGGVDVLLKIDNDNLFAYIDYSKIQGKLTDDHLAYIEKPETVRIKNVEPKHFKVIKNNIK